MLIFATQDDLTDPDPPWVSTMPNNAGVLLRYATIEVARACAINLYGDTPSSTALPVLRDATCAQVASWVALGVDPAKAGTDMPGPVKSSKILDASVERDTTAATSAMADARDGLCSLAVDLLQSAGLLWLPSPLGDERPYLPTYGLSGPVNRWGYALPDIDSTSWPFV